MIREAIKDLARLRQITAALVRHGFGEVLARSRMADLAEKTATPVDEAERQKSSARRFRELLTDLGPTFVKLGQTMSTRYDLLPAALAAELSTLQDQVPPITIEQVYQQIETGLGRPVAELFRDIDSVPMASASIAQVHLARTLDGQEVVIKVQRPKIAESIRADVDLLYYLAWALEALFEEAGLYAPRGIVEEFDRYVHEELDFEHEAANIRTFAKNHAQRPYVRVPAVVESLSSRTVLTLERLHGAKITDADWSAHDRKAVVTHLVEASFRQLFEDGVFHGDPHPGNVLVLDGPGDVIGLLDFGAVGRVSKAMQEAIVTLVMACALKDADTVARLLYRVGVSDGHANLTRFRDDIAQILDRYLGQATTLQEISAESLLRDLLDLAVRYRIRVPKEYAALGRASILVEGMIRKIYPEMNVMEVAGPYARQLLKEKFDTSDLQGTLMRVALRLQGFATEVPLQLSQILIDLESGKLTVSVKSPVLDRVASNIKGLGITIYLGLLSSAFLMGAFIAFSHSSWQVRGIPGVGLVGVLLFAATMGAGLTWVALSGRGGKIRLSRWLRK